VKLGRLSVGTAKPVRSGIDDLLSSTEGGKHDYDWYVIQIWHDLELVDSIWGIKPRNHVFKKTDRTNKESGNKICAILAVLCSLRLILDPGLIAENFSSSQHILIYFD